MVAGVSKYTITCGGQSVDGSASLKVTPKEEALMKGAMAGGVIWLMIVPTLFIPIVHLIAPPVLFLAGPVVFLMIYKMFNGRSTLKLAAANCPNCKDALTLPSAFDAWPANGVCMNCKTSYAANLGN